MSFKYQTRDLKPMTYELLDSSVRQIHKEINDFLVRENLRIRYVVPILRGGCIPATLLAYFFGVIDMLPIQVKSGPGKRSFETKIGFDYDVKLASDECVLLVDGNQATGKTASIARKMIIDKLGKKTKIIYACVTQDYAHKDVPGNFVFTTAALYTNETKALSEKECQNLGVEYAPVYLYPWENKQTEIDALNA